MGDDDTAIGDLVGRNEKGDNGKPLEEKQSNATVIEDRIYDEEPALPTSKTLRVKDRKLHPCCYMAPRPGSDDYENEKVRDYLSVLKKGMLHKCKKKCQTAEKPCKHNFGKKGKPIIENTEFKKGSMFIKRNHGFLVQHTPIMTQQLRCNTNTQWLGCGEEVYTAIAYVCDYICKASLKTRDMLPIITQIVAHKAEWETVLAGDTSKDKMDKLIADKKRLLLKCLNKITTHKTRSGVFICSKLLGYQHEYKTNGYISIYVNGMLDIFPGDP